MAGDPPITPANLYGTSGGPHGSDIVQGGLGDCYLISTLGQYADRQPAVIRDAIHYDDKSHDFSVDLYDRAGHRTTIPVTQDDLRADRSYGTDHSGGVDSPIRWAGTHTDRSPPPAWPAVFEVAYAKLHASSAKDATAADLDHIANGGWPKDAIHALTGQTGTREVQASQLRDPAKAYDLLETAIHEGRPVLLATNPLKDKPNDGLVKGTYLGEGDHRNSGHAYTVEGISKNSDGAVSLTLRNPWGTNNFPLQGVTSSDPVVHVALKTILDNGHLENVTIGPRLVQERTVSDADRPEHASPQNLVPAPAPSNWSAAGHWADLAAKGRELTANPVSAAPSIAHNAGASPESLRGLWISSVAGGVEPPLAGAAQASATGSTPSTDQLRTLWTKSASPGAETAAPSIAAARTDTPSSVQSRGRTL